MTHFGIICPGAATGPLNTMLPLGTLDTQSKALAAGIEFQAIGEKDLIPGSTAESFTKLGQLRGLAAFRYTIDLLKQVSSVTLQDAPAAIKAAGVEALLVNQSSVEGGTIAEFLKIPFITVCSAVVLNREPSIPPFFTTWKYSPTAWARLRNQIGYTLVNSVVKPLEDLINEYRREWKLPLYSSLKDSYSPLAQISNAPAEFEFPREELAPWFHFTGSYHTSANRIPVSFPYEKLTGKPLIYASMGLRKIDGETVNLCFDGNIAKSFDLGFSDYCFSL